MSAEFAYRGSLDAQEGIDPFAERPAIFNGSLLVIDSFCLFLPRIVLQQRPRRPDILTAIGAYKINPDTLRATKIAHILRESLQQEGSKGLFNGALSPEDLRGIVLPDHSLMFGLTAAGLDGVPHAAILTARPPFRPEDFSPMKVLFELPSMKNIMPLDANTIAGRPEVARDKKQRIVFARLQDGQEKWSIVGETTFPDDIPWVGANGRFGLGGWNDRTPIPNKPGYFRFLIHGYKKDNNGMVEYAIGLAEGWEQPDGTFSIIGVDKRPMLTYADAIAQVEMKTGKRGREPDPNKRVIYTLGGVRYGDQIILPITLYDNESHFWTIPVLEMLREFSTM